MSLVLASAAGIEFYIPRGPGSAVSPLEILPPVSTAGFTSENIEKLIEQVRNEVAPRVRTD